MADFVNREAVRNKLYDSDAITMRGVAILNNFPSADVVEVVRCKNCKHLKYGYQCYYPLGMMLNNDGDAYVLVDPDEDFCSYGERRDDGNG